MQIGLRADLKLHVQYFALAVAVDPQAQGAMTAQVEWRRIAGGQLSPSVLAVPGELGRKVGFGFGAIQRNRTTVPPCG